MAEPGHAGRGAIAGETGVVWVSLAAGHVLNLVSLSLVSASLGLEAFGTWGLCLIDFGIFANLANFALPVAAVPLAARSGMSRSAFSLGANARLWTTCLSLAGYLLFEAAFRPDPETLKASLILGLAIALNPQQLEWWSVARRTFADLLAHRLASGLVTLALVLLWVRADPGLVSAAGSLAAGQAAGFLVLAARARSGFPAWIPPGHPGLRELWKASLPVALTGVFDFLFLPLGYYAFRFAHGEGDLLGAYGTSHRLALAASLAASSLFLVLLPRFSRAGSPEADAAGEDARLAARLDRAGMAFLALLIPVPFLTRPVLSLLFPGTDWNADSLGFASWALACMAASTCLHLLRMAPLTKALAEGKSRLYAGTFFLAGGANVLAVLLAARSGATRALPAWSLAADALFTAWWILHLHRRRPASGALRVALLLSALGAYLAWAHRFA